MPQSYPYRMLSARCSCIHSTFSESCFSDTGWPCHLTPLVFVLACFIEATSPDGVNCETPSIVRRSSRLTLDRMAFQKHVIGYVFVRTPSFFFESDKLGTFCSFHGVTGIVLVNDFLLWRIKGCGRQAKETTTVQCPSIVHPGKLQVRGGR